MKRRNAVLMLGLSVALAMHTALAQEKVVEVTVDRDITKAPEISASTRSN